VVLGNSEGKRKKKKKKKRKSEQDSPERGEDGGLKGEKHWKGEGWLEIMN
jgi:hypothetical protein